MDRRILSASSFNIAVECVWPWTSGAGWSDGSVGGKRPWSQRLGTAVHLAAELGGTSTILSDPSLTDRQKEIGVAMYNRWESWWNEYGDPFIVKREIPVWWSPSRGESGFIKNEKHRDYSSAPEDAICATIDLYRPNEGIDFADLKTGWAAKRPEDSWQMKVISAALMPILGKRDVTSAIFSLKEGGVDVWRWTFMEEENNKTATEARRVLSLIADGDTRQNAGAHCKYCPVKIHCDAFAEKEKQDEQRRSDQSPF